jgi:hypothetical protein
MPHINLVYPFIPDNNNGENFLDASQRIQNALSDMEPFQIRFTKDSFKYFMHRKNCTLWLKPLTGDVEIGAAATEHADAQCVVDVGMTQGDAESAGIKERHAHAVDIDSESAQCSSSTGQVAVLSKKQAKRAKRKEEKAQQMLEQREAADDIGSMHPNVLQLQSIIETQFPDYTVRQLL